MSGSAPSRAGRDVLQLGPGRRVYARQPGDCLVRLDIREASAPDVLWDLNRVPWPLENDSFDLIDCTDVLEHLDDLVKAPAFYERRLAWIFPAWFISIDLEVVK